MAEIIIPPVDFTLSQERAENTARIIRSTHALALPSPISGRDIGVSLSIPEGDMQDGLMLAYYPFASNIQKGIQPWAASVESTGIPLIGIEMPGHGKSFSMTREEASRFSHGDVQWYTAEVEAALSEYAPIKDLPELNIGLGMSAGATFISAHANESRSTFERLVLFDPANLSKRSSTINFARYILGQLTNKSEYFAPLEQGVVQAAANELDNRPAIHEWRYSYLVLGPTAVNGAVTRDLNCAMGRHNGLHVTVYYAEHSETVLPQDIQYLSGEIASRSAERRKRLLDIMLEGETHHFDRNAFRIGEMTRLALSGI